MRSSTCTYISVRPVTGKKCKLFNARGRHRREIPGSVSGDVGLMPQKCLTLQTILPYPHNCTQSISVRWTPLLTPKHHHYHYHNNRQYHSHYYTEMRMLSFWRNFHHSLQWKLSKWQLPVQPMIKISSKWRHFRFKDIAVISKTCEIISELTISQFFNTKYLDRGIKW